MKPEDVVEFLTILPDGAVEEAGGFLVWPGRPAGEAIGEILRDLGCQVEPIYSVGEKGWEFGFRYRDRRQLARVTQIERHVATFWDPNLWPRIVGRTHPLHLELLERLKDTLPHDPRFHDLRWCASAEFEPTLTEDLEPAG